jgi:hypothetical protein
MKSVFLSYSSKDYFFAELAEIKLQKAGISLWLDHGELVAGTDWRQGIERGISSSIAILVALSAHSSESSYVTYEWAYGIGKGKTIIPLKLSECVIHPRLQIVQYLDFSNARTLPWQALIDRVNEIEVEAGEPIPDVEASSESPGKDPGNAYVKMILAYLNKRGYQRASFEKIRRRIDAKLTDEVLQDIVQKNPAVFRSTTLEDGKIGLSKVIP